MKKFNEYKPQIAPTKSFIGLPSVAKNKVAYLSMALIIGLGVGGYSFIQSYKTNQAKEELANTNRVISSINKIIEDDKSYLKTILNDYFYNDRSTPEMLENTEAVKTIGQLDFDEIIANQKADMIAYEEAQKALSENFFFLNQEVLQPQDWSVVFRKTDRFKDNFEYQEYLKYSAVKEPNKSLKGMLASYHKIKQSEITKARQAIMEMGNEIDFLNGLIEKGNLKKREPEPPAPPIVEKTEAPQATDLKDQKTEVVSSTPVKTEEPKPVEEPKKEAPKPKPQPKKPASNVPVW